MLRNRLRVSRRLTPCLFPSNTINLELVQETRSGTDGREVVSNSLAYGMLITERP